MRLCGVSWASTPMQGRPPFFLDWSFEHQFNSSSRTLSETIGRWILLMSGVGTLWGAVITDKAKKMKIRILMWPTAVSLFLKLRKSFLIRLHSSTFVYTRLVTRLHLSTFVCDSSAFVYTRLHSSSDSSVFRIDLIFVSLKTL